MKLKSASKSMGLKKTSSKHGLVSLKAVIKPILMPLYLVLMILQSSPPFMIGIFMSQMGSYWDKTLINTYRVLVYQAIND